MPTIFTHYVQCILPGETLHADQWKPWANVKPTDDLAVMAAYKFAREAGYLNPLSESEGIEIDVCHFPVDAPRHPNGQPQVVSVMRARIVRNEEQS